VKVSVYFLFWLTITFTHGQNTELVQDTVFFSYDHKGLFPKELIIYKDSLSASEIYHSVKKALTMANEVLVDYNGKITNEKVNKSFTLKGKFLYVFCHNTPLGKVCSDGLIEIDFIFREGSYTMKPTKIKRAVDIENIPINGRAFFYKKDNTLKKQFSGIPNSVESILTWLAIFSGLEDSTNNEIPK
jgi:hypothetical protein